MALVKCKQCGQAFISGADNEKTCPACATRLRALYPAVRNFLRDNERQVYTAGELSQILNIELQDIKGILAMELIDLGSPKGSALPAKPATQSSTGMHAYTKRQKGDGNRG